VHITAYGDINEFWELYMTNSELSVTIKLHLLVCHVKEMLNMYGRAGLFAKDSHGSPECIDLAAELTSA